MQNMKTIIVLAQKGGVGKTFLSINLAASFAAQGYKVGLIDTDFPQYGSYRWKERRLQKQVEEYKASSNSGEALPDDESLMDELSAKDAFYFDVIKLNEIDSLGILLNETKARGAEVILIDTSPRTDGLAADVVEKADFIIMPCGAAFDDIDAIENSYKIALNAHKPCGVILNNIVMQGQEKVLMDAVEDLGMREIPTIPLLLFHRVAIVHAFRQGKIACELDPKGKATEEMEMLVSHLKNELKMSR